MKKKVSITVEEALLREVDRIAGNGSRSTVIEQAVVAFIRDRRRTEIHLRDLTLLDRHAETFNAVAFDVLEYQAHWEDPGVEES